MAKKRMRMPTFDWQPGTGGNPGRLKRDTDDIVYDMPYSDVGTDNEHNGMRITKTAFRGLLADFASRRPNVFDVAHVTFSKAALFRILAQEGCELVRFYFAFPAPEHLSLVIEGCGADGMSLDKSVLISKGEDLVNLPADKDYEEKGNGGNDQSGNIKLLSEAYNQVKGTKDFKFFENNNSEEARQKLGILLLKAINNLSLE